MVRPRYFPRRTNEQLGRCDRMGDGRRNGNAASEWAANAGMVTYISIGTVYIPSPRLRNVLLQDRFADARSRPPVDTQQDWTMVSGREENGWTIMAFSRALQTGDDRDRDIVQVCMPTAVLRIYVCS